MFGEGNVVFQSLIAHEAVMGLSQNSVFMPLLAVLMIRALPTELNSHFLYCTGDKGTADFHSALALAPGTSAIGFAVVHRTKPT